MAKSEDLKELKKNECGKGLLIENDGYILTTKEILREGIENGEEWFVPNPFIVKAVFQKYDVKNANGRIYPEAVLKKEVERYQQRVRDRRAIGECYTPDAMVLTAYNGWKPIEEVKEGEEILTLNPSTNKIEIKPIIRKIEKDWEGYIYNVKNKFIDDFVTPKHTYPLYSSRNGKFKGMCTAEDMKNSNFSDLGKCYIPKQGEWTEKGEDYFILKGIKEDELKTSEKINYSQWMEDEKIPMSTFMKFIGIYLSEGCLKYNANYILIYQKKKEVVDKIDELLTELNLPYKKEERANDYGYTFIIHDKRLKKYLEALGNCYSKYIPIELKNQSKENLKLLYDWFVMGDGRIRGDKRDASLTNRKNLSLSDDVFSTSKQLILDLNEIQLKIGFSGSYHKEERNNDRYIGDRLIEGKNCKPLHFTYRSLNKGIGTNKNFLKINEVYYSGKVFCVEVENHIFYVMQNGKTHWTGNCNHPESSSIDLSRVSHNITELHWEGHTLVGEMEIFTSYGFRKHGIVTTCGDIVANLLLSGYKIGVSSRAIGSVTEKLGTLIVGDDLEILAWDVVADPSTPGAFIYSDDNEKTMYVEKEIKDEEKDKLNEKIKKIKGIIG